MMERFHNHKSKERVNIQAKSPVWRPEFQSRLYMTLVAMSVLYLGALPARAQEQMAKEAQNPIARMISVPLENDFNPHTGIDKEDSYVLEMKPVVPFQLSKDWNVITRTIVPIIQVPDLTPEVKGTTGLGDVNLSLFLSPAKAGRVIWGAGPIVSFLQPQKTSLAQRKSASAQPLLCLKLRGTGYMERS